MGKNLDYSYVNENGKRVSGSAAFNHHVFTEQGGIQNYNDSVGAEYIKAFIESNSDAINRKLTNNARKRRMKKIG